jgi:hypothetical protein
LPSEFSFDLLYYYLLVGLYPFLISSYISIRFPFS